MENETRFAGQLLSTDSEPRYYGQPQFDRSRQYYGPLSECTDEEGRAMLEQCTRFFSFHDMPLPPYGLPGTRICPTRDDPEYELLLLGFRYFRAMARGEARTLHNLWGAAGRMLSEAAAKERRIVEEAAFALEVEALRATNPNWPFTISDDEERFVYFISGESGPIKIGVAIDPEKRLKSLQTSHHEKLTILVTCKGGQPLEAEYHKRFAVTRLHGEWFERSPEILAEIERLKGEAG